MPTENEKQLTAMSTLREKLLNRIKSDSCSEFEENILNEITHSINTELLATERQQLIGAYSDGQQSHDFEFASDYYNNTFKTQETK